MNNSARISSNNGLYSKIAMYGMLTNPSQNFDDEIHGHHKFEILPTRVLARI